MIDFEHIGPVQLLVVGFDQDADYRGLILDELESLSVRGMIRVIDLQFVMKEASGNLIALQGSDLSQDEAIEFGAIIGGLIGLGEGGVEGAVAGAQAGALMATDKSYGLSVGDLQAIAADLKPGQAVGMLLFEHKWAARLKQAIRTTGGFPIAQGFLTPEALFMVGAEVKAMVEAEETIELAEAIKGAALIDALMTVEAAEQVKAAAIAEAVQTLVVAGLIEEAATRRAIDVLIVAGLIEEAAMQEAEAAVAQSEREIAAAQAAIETALGDGA